MSRRHIHRLNRVESSPALYTVQDVQGMIEQLRNPGVICPCCEQLVKVYSRKFNSTMARGLIWMYWWVVHTDQLWVHVNQLAPEWLTRNGGTFALMKFWGFIHEMPNDDTRKRCAGHWRMDMKAIGAVTQAEPFPTYAYMLNGACIGMSQETTTLRKALGVKFDYEAMMKNHAGIGAKR